MTREVDAFEAGARVHAARSSTKIPRDLRLRTTASRLLDLPPTTDAILRNSVGA